MKLQFKQQQYQHDASMAVVNCFSGQSKGYRKEVVGRTVDPIGLPGMAVSVDEIFSNKKLELSSEEILKNVQELQREQGLKAVNKLAGYIESWGRGIDKITHESESFNGITPSFRLDNGL